MIDTMVVVCAGCEKPIMDRFLMNVADQTWHPTCVSCADCGTSLTEKCFSRDGRLYCRDDFFRQFGTKCAGCNNGISPNELVRKARDSVYHLNCFVCLACKKPLSTGQELYVINDSSFLCKEDYIKTKVNSGETDELDDAVFENEQIDAQSDAGDLSDKETSFDGDQITSPHTEDSFKDGNHINNNNNDIVRSEKDSGSDKEESNSIDDSNGNKRRGPRTTIKAKQLEVLKAAFSATPKPTRHIREQLAAETGLNMRVIQVWFQNRRSKERRLKQMNTLGGRRPFFGRSGRRMRGSHIDDSPDMPPHYGFFPQDGQPEAFYPPGMYPTYPGQEFYHNNAPHQPEPTNFISNPTPIIDMPPLSHSGPTHENGFIPSDLSQSSPEQAMMVPSSMSGDTSHFPRTSAGPYNHLTPHHPAPIESW